eukprot:3481509-Rhodomonas_salina.1
MPDLLLVEREEEAVEGLEERAGERDPVDHERRRSERNHSPQRIEPEPGARASTSDLERMCK